MAHTTVHLVRHGHVIWTPDEDGVLSPEARAGADHVAALLASKPISAVYASTMRRAAQTVEPLARSLRLPVTALEGLRERQLSGGRSPTTASRWPGAGRTPSSRYPAASPTREAYGRLSVASP